MNILQSLMCTAALVACGATTNAQSAQPNVILILADDMGYETVGAYGGTSYATPSIDRLADEGIRFDNAHSQPLCTPSRVQIMTGRYNVRNYDVFELLHEGQTTFANYLRSAGYRTFIGGKWQLSEQQSGSSQDPIEFGFDEYYLWQLERRPQRYYAPGFEATIPAEGWNGAHLNYPAGPEFFGPDLVVNQINNFITRSQSEPFFVYYPMLLPHNPFLPTPDDPDYDPTATTEPDDAQYFGSMMAYSDKMVGRILTHLDELNLSDNTIVIFAGDNGTKDNVVSICNGQSIRGGKGLMTDAGTHVPLIVRWPSHVPASSSSDTLVDFTDILPTMLSAVDLPTTGDLDGQSFLPQMLGQSGSPREWIYCWYKPRTDNESQATDCVQNTSFKLYRNGSYFDLNADILESTPLDTGSLLGDALASYQMLETALAGFDADVADRSLAPRLANSNWNSAAIIKPARGDFVVTAESATDRNGPVEYQYRSLPESLLSEWTRSSKYTFLYSGTPGEMAITYRVRDLLGNESNWSETLAVTVPEPLNPRLPIISQPNQDGDAGALNIGQSFTIPPDKDGWFLSEVRFYSTDSTTGAGSCNLTLYDAFTDLTHRGNIIATSTNAVANPGTSGALMRFQFDPIKLEGGLRYYAVVSDADGNALPSGQGLPTQRDLSAPYPGGDNLKESGANEAIDLRFEVIAYAYPESFSQWQLLQPEASDLGFTNAQNVFGLPNGLCYFLGAAPEHSLSHLPVLNPAENSFTFQIAYGVYDLDWSVRTTEDLATPKEDWSVIARNDPNVNIDYTSRTVEVSLPFSGNSLFATLEVYPETE
ncbi:sulfatase-like hydrolase/transferase [Coraliomargarita parva]|uniref:sulfatase-like hydrolase/transferase n=1 Tax=Coraliomargarita parva TaxID=3014050 RepID=UPI0022B2B55A|nr:sulfatase-like hydrolase/transferase [Coraliomargarita parva]